MLARAPSVPIRHVRGLTPAVASPDAPGVATAHVWGQTPTLSVTDTDEVQAPRRRRRPCLCAIAPLEQACQLLGRALEHRPNQRADHVPQEAVGGQLELERVAAPVPDRALDSAPEDPVLRLGRRESPEIVLAEQEICRLGK